MSSKPFGLPGVFVKNDEQRAAGGYAGLKGQTLPQPQAGADPMAMSPAGLARQLASGGPGGMPGGAPGGAPGGMPVDLYGGGPGSYGAMPPGMPEGFGLTPYNSPIPQGPAPGWEGKMPNAAPPMAYNPYMPGGVPDAGFGRSSAPGLSPAIYSGPAPDFYGAVANAGQHYSFPKATAADWYGADSDRFHNVENKGGGVPEEEEFWKEFDERYGGALEHYQEVPYHIEAQHY